MRRNARSWLGCGCAGEPINTALIQPGRSLSTRDPGQDQRDPHARLWSPRGTPLLAKGSARVLEDADIPRRAASSMGRSTGDPSPPGSNSSSCRRSAEADILIADNLGSHKGKAARDAIRSVGAKLFFLPTCSPDLNPIERVFAKLRTLLRKADERSIEATWQRIGDMLSASSAEECATYLRHTGYASIQA